MAMLLGDSEWSSISVFDDDYQSDEDAELSPLDDDYVRDEYRSYDE